MGAALEVRDLRKRFGKRTALDGLSMQVPVDSMTAFVGANGAGKSTTFSLIAGFFGAQSGEILVAGTALKRFRLNGGMIGMLPQDVLMFESRSVERQLLLFAALSGLWGKQAWAEVDRVLDLVSLTERANDLVADLSHGMKVRLGVAQALVGNPPLILLDEPTAGLDPQMISAFKTTMTQLRGSTTVVISSHDLNQLESMCDYVCIIDRGKLLRQGPMRELLSKVSKVNYHLEKDFSELPEIQKEFRELRFSLIDPVSLSVEFEPERLTVAEVNSRVLRWLFKHGAGVVGVASQRSLEQTYLEETQGAKS
jgi:ABC-2 type transport system ATP-binding protein